MIKFKDKLTILEDVFMYYSSIAKNSWASGMFEHQKSRFLGELDLYETLIDTPNDRILDIGGAPYYTDAVLSKMTTNLQILDIDPSRFHGVAERYCLNIKKCNIEKEKIDSVKDNFDGIILAEVFEHLRVDLNETTREIHRVLRPGGWFYLSTPNFLSLGRSIKLLKEGKTSPIFPAYEKLRDVGHMGHTREYTKNDICEFLQLHGFEIERVIYRGLGYNTLARAIKRAFPSLRDWFGVVARKI